MHDIEPYFKWREYYVAADDSASPFFGRIYNEFQYTQKIYNYFIHPQWDDFGSQTLYAKVLYVDYLEGIAMIELIGEWNDCINNDIMLLKRDLADYLMKNDIFKFIILCDNVLNFHGDDDSYYEEWYEDVSDEGGWVALVNLNDHVQREMESTRVQYYFNMGPHLNDVTWRLKTPQLAIDIIKLRMQDSIRQLRY